MEMVHPDKRQKAAGVRDKVTEPYDRLPPTNCFGDWKFPKGQQWTLVAFNRPMCFEHCAGRCFSNVSSRKTYPESQPQLIGLAEFETGISDAVAPLVKPNTDFPRRLLLQASSLDVQRIVPRNVTV